MSALAIAVELGVGALDAGRRRLERVRRPQFTPYRQPWVMQDRQGIRAWFRVVVAPVVDYGIDADGVVTDTRIIGVSAQLNTRGLAVHLDGQEGVLDEAPGALGWEKS